MSTVKPILSGHSKKKTKIGFQDQLSLNAGQKYCRMLQREHSAILSTFIKLPSAVKNSFCLFLRGRFRQVLLYFKNSVDPGHSALDKLLGQLGTYATWLSSIAYLQKQLRIFIFFKPRFFSSVITRFLIA